MPISLKMAKVIDRLRVEGISASRENTFMSRENALQTIENSSVKDKSWIGRGDTFTRSNKQNSSKEYLTNGSNPASRRVEVLMRTRAANQGLSSLESDFCLAPVQFMLQGTTVKNKLQKYPTETSIKLFQNRSENQVSENVQRHIKVHIEKARSEPGPLSRANTRRGDTRLPQCSTSASNFMLGPSQSPFYSGMHSGKMMKRAFEGFELTGRKVKNSAHKTPRFGYRDVYPHDVDIPSRNQKQRWVKTYKDSPSPLSTVDGDELNHYLHVNQSITLPLGTDDQGLKLKNYTQFVKKDTTTNNNNPYYKAKQRGKCVKEDMRYQFDSVSSYIHFNRIYQQPRTGRAVAVQIPQLAGFPAHCTDTILLRMMLEMNKPLKKSSAKYSDVAVHKDLDEYLMVRSPSSFSRAYSSKKSAKSETKSRDSSNEEKIETEGGCEWAAAAAHAQEMDENRSLDDGGEEGYLSENIDD